MNDNLSNDELSETLQYLVEEGLVECAWSEEKNDFVFSITEKGIERHKDFFPEEHE